MNCDQKQLICSSCSRNDVCMRKYGVCNGVDCPIDAFSKPVARKNQKILKQVNEVDKIIEEFFKENGNLPEEYYSLKEEFQKEKASMGECSSCQLNGLMRKYKNKILNGSF